MIELDTIYNEDCLEGMKRIPDGSVDCIISDLPYGTTACSWDTIIPFDKLWEQSKRGQYVFNNDGNVPSNDDTKINAIRILCDSNYIYDTEMDLSFGLGNKLISGEPNCFVTIAGKAYFMIVPSSTQIHLDRNESIIFRTRLYFRKAN